MEVCRLLAESGSSQTHRQWYPNAMELDVEAIVPVRRRSVVSGAPAKTMPSKRKLQKMTPRKLNPRKVKLQKVELQKLKLRKMGLHSLKETKQFLVTLART